MLVAPGAAYSHDPTTPEATGACALAGEDADRPIARRGGVEAPNRLPAVVRLMLRLALAIVTVLVCVGIATPVLRTAKSLAGVVNAVAQAGAGSERSVASRPSRQCQEDAVGPAFSSKAIASECDEDEDEDPLCDVPDDGALALRRAPPPRDPGRFLRGEAVAERSRFARGPGLPRGPPT